MFVAERRLIEPTGLALANNVMPHGRNLTFSLSTFMHFIFDNFLHKYTAFTSFTNLFSPPPIPLDVGDRQHRRNSHVLFTLFC